MDSLLVLWELQLLLDNAGSITSFLRKLLPSALCGTHTWTAPRPPSPEASGLGLLNNASEMGMLEEGLSFHPTHHGLDKGTRDSQEADGMGVTERRRQE